jgi:hypothetical protein
MRELAGCLIAIVCLGLCSTTASADPPRDEGSGAYHATIDQALQEHNAGRFAEARALFLRAHQLQPSARTLRGLGLVEFELRHYAAAIRFLTMAQSDTRNPLNDAHRTEAAALLNQANAFVGRYRLEFEPTDATVMVDGEPVAPEDRQMLLLDVGEHTVGVQAPAYRAQARRLDVKGGEQQALRFKLDRASGPTETPPVDTIGALKKPADSQPILLRRATWGWVSVGGAALALVGTGFAWRAGETAAARWNDDATCLRDGKTRGQNCAADSHAAKVARTWTAAGLITTAALGAAAVLLLWPAVHEPHDDRAAGASTAACGVGPGDLGVACVVRF